MKKLIVPVLAALLIGAASGRAQTSNVTGVVTNTLETEVEEDLVQTSVTANVKVDFTGSTVDVTGKAGAKLTTESLGDTNLSFVAVEISAGDQTNTTLEIVTTFDVIDTNGVTNVVVVAETNTVLSAGTLTNESFSALIGSLTTSNEVPIGGGLNLIVVITQGKILLKETSSLVADNDKIVAIYGGEVGTNDPGVIKRQLLLSGSALTNKVSLKASGVWEDGVSALKSGSFKNQKTK